VPEPEEWQLSGLPTFAFSQKTPLFAHRIQCPFSWLCQWNQAKKHILGRYTVESIRELRTVPVQKHQKTYGPISVCLLLVIALPLFGQHLLFLNKHDLFL